MGGVKRKRLTVFSRSVLAALAAGWRIRVGGLEDHRTWVVGPERDGEAKAYSIHAGTFHALLDRGLIQSVGRRSVHFFYGPTKEGRAAAEGLTLPPWATPAPKTD